MPVYNKLVRDRIPEVIEKTGKDFATRILSTEEYKTELDNKLSEELIEYREANTREEVVEELADILELVHAAAKMHSATIEQLEEVRRTKAEKRGGFGKRIFLIEIDDLENK